MHEEIEASTDVSVPSHEAGEVVANTDASIPGDVDKEMELILISFLMVYIFLIIVNILLHSIGLHLMQQQRFMGRELSVEQIYVINLCH